MGSPCPACGGSITLTQGERRWFASCAVCGLKKMGRSRSDVLTRLESVEKKAPRQQTQSCFDLSNLGILTDK